MKLNLSIAAKQEIQKLFPHIEKLKTNEVPSQFYEVLMRLYSNIYEADRYISKLMKSKQFTQHLQKITTAKEIPYPSSYSSFYFPKIIRETIDLQTTYYIKYKAKIKNRQIEIFFVILLEDDILGINIHQYQRYAKYILMWLYMAQSYSSKSCAKTLKIYIYLSNFDKILPQQGNKVLGPFEANSAYTYACIPNGEITIFRSEEWFKVLIHESFHSFGLDLSGVLDTHVEKLKMQMKTIFPIDSDFNLSESYTEFWARVLNALFCSYGFLDKKTDKKGFIRFSMICLDIERVFSLYQSVKVLDYMGLEYKNLFLPGTPHLEVRKQLYKEGTNIFVYYVIVALLMNNYADFMVWCLQNNTNFLNFTPNIKNVEGFMNYIRLHYNSNDLLANFSQLNKFLVRQKQKKPGDKLTTTMRMSLIEWDN